MEPERTIEDELNYLTICDRAIEYYNDMALKFASKHMYEENETPEEQIARANAKYYATLKENMLLVLLQNPKFLNYANSFNIPREENKQEELPKVL